MSYDNDQIVYRLNESNANYFLSLFPPFHEQETKQSIAKEVLVDPRFHDHIE